MNHKEAHKVEDLCLEVMRLSLTANRVSKKAIFCEFSGHVSQLSLRVKGSKQSHFCKDCGGGKNDLELDTYAYLDKDWDNPLTKLQNMIAQLTKIIKEAR